MSHELAFDSNNNAMMAYNGANGHPWHRLGTEVDGLGTIDQMLAAAQADFTVYTVPLEAVFEDGTRVRSTTHVATATDIVDITDEGVTTKHHGLGVVGTDWNIEQNRDATEFAYEIVGASKGDALIDTMGVMRDRKEFFTYLRLEPLVLDPNGIADRIEQGLAVRNAHDGRLSLTAYPTDIRVVCMNTANWSERRAKNIVRVRHTKNKADFKRAAIATLGLQQRLRDEFVEMAEALIAAPGGRNVLDSTIKYVWPKAATMTDQQVKNWSDRRTTLQRLYGQPTNAGGFGDSAWSVWNTITEYVDHKRKGTDTNRALASINPDNEQSKLKVKAAQHLLAGV